MGITIIIKHIDKSVAIEVDRPFYYNVKYVFLRILCSVELYTKEYKVSGEIG